MHARAGTRDPVCSLLIICAHSLQYKSIRIIRSSCVGKPFEGEKAYRLKLLLSQNLRHFLNSCGGNYAAWEIL